MGVWVAIAVLPRATAAAVINRAVSRSAWAVACTILVLDLPGLLDVFASRGLEGRLAVPLIALVAMICALVLTALRPAPWLVLLYLLFGGACVVVYQWAILAADPSIQTEVTYLLNRPAVAILLVGSASAGSLLGALWCSLGFIVSLSATALAAVLAGRPTVFGWGPTLLFTAYLATYLTLALVQRSQRRRVPSFAAAEERVKRTTFQRELARRTASVVHDTVLNDLSFIISAPDQLDETARQRLRDDVATLTSADWLTQARELTDVDNSDAFVRNRLAALVSEMQWRGLTVHVSSNGSTALRSSNAAAAAGVDAARACLENVLAHSGVTVAEIVFGQENGESTIMVIDQGCGFDPDAVPADRIGLKVSVVQRVEAVGGYVRVWSAPGDGTSVLISVPVLAAEDSTVEASAVEDSTVGASAVEEGAVTDEPDDTE
jgi:signal transduction histidine kinase